MRRLSRITLTALLVAALFVVWSAPAANAAVCSGTPVPYPGNSASSEQYANWMANGTRALGLPGELPVMAALVESGLRNLNYGDADSVGFFQMRTSIWNKGIYKGYLKNPDLQLQWFTDTATSVRAYWVKNKKGDPAASSSSYGEWIADVERPASQYRGRYQPRLAEARKLIAATCPGLQGINVTAPIASLSFKRRQHPGRSGRISVGVKCKNLPCNTSVSAVFRLPGHRGSRKVSSDTTMLAAGQRGKVLVPISSRLKKRLRSSLRGGRTTRARLRIAITGSSGAQTVYVRRITLAR